MSKNKNLAGNLFAAIDAPLALRETALSKQIAAWLDGRGIYHDCLDCGKIKTAGGHSAARCKAGTPERFCIVKGQIIFIEVKRRGAKPTSVQSKRHLRLRAAGAIVVLCDSFDSFMYQMTVIRAALESANMELIL